MPKKKIPWLAAVLNILVNGLGYIYIGKRKAFGLLLMLAQISTCVWVLKSQPASVYLFRDFWISLSGILYSAAFAFDAYKLAKETN
ncbi:MAG: hypothetical protein KJ880_01830 [Candidatus Omnitrophica bacterium]|nr:hypothetical protein [Candidatus Omnitrophota bacterium]MBU1870379.1 hypothetical protein [Candidatus Omnitrophota bacterium]